MGDGNKNDALVCIDKVMGEHYKLTESVVYIHVGKQMIEVALNKHSKEILVSVFRKAPGHTPGMIFQGGCEIKWEGE